MRPPLSIPILILALTASAHADSITLRRATHLPVRQGDILLKHVAELEGPAAQQLGDVVLRRDIENDATIEITVQHVRDALDQAGVNWGRISLSGWKTTVRPARTAGASRPVANEGLALPGSKPRPERRRLHRDETTAEDAMAHNTLRSAIASYIASGLRAQPARLTLAFDPQDAFLLDRTVGDIRYEIQPTSSLRSDRIELTINEWTDGAVNEQHQVTVHPKLHVETVRSTTDLSRKQTIEEHHLQVQRQWLPPSQAALACPLVKAVGRITTRNLRAGELLRSTDLMKQMLISRGDLVTVRCLVGGVAITMQAEARDKGAIGDRIEFRKKGERENFTATVTGPAEAVVDLSR